eukprot:TRINITY_DN34722_c0_g1_i1.p1 TRINITY_DN34722_c0_g1~~TRINITY_DN34722_c0_g1_i1.p1  ORF type:complete len:341 (-),score=75.60 TRINITY_DN34722_c0_g1_i1:397-1419(-)
MAGLGFQRGRRTALRMAACAACTAVVEALARLKVPAFLDCSEEAGFSPVWTSFRKRATASADMGWPLDPELALAAAQILERFDDVSTGRSWVHPAGAVWESFRTAAGKEDAPMLPPDLQVLPGAGPLGQGMIVESSRGAARGHNCLYGLVTALFVAYRHAVPRMAEDAHRHLELILWMLGETEGGEQLFDFIESTSWPVRSIDVELNLEIAKSGPPVRFVRFTRARADIEHLRGPRLQPDKWALHRVEAFQRLAVFGVHGATSLEPASAIQASALASGTGAFPLQIRYYGHPCPSYSKTGYLCQWAKEMLPSGAEAETVATGDAVAELFAEMVDITDRHV